MHYHGLVKTACSSRIGGVWAILIHVPFLFTIRLKFNTPKAQKKNSKGRFIHQMNFYLSLDIQMYPKYPHFWALWSSQHSHRCSICPVLMFVPQSRSISLLYRILSVYFSSFIKKKKGNIDEFCHRTLNSTKIAVFVCQNVLMHTKINLSCFLLIKG